ncbi:MULTISPECIES: hypothetical protein [unclassified Methylobacterium]|uniref:hypothetical protein n=1 Tax=unclassified Methylobacterium TaxID=2615210 RepID=UPI001F225CF5|nr:MULTISPECIES: hypothetical protein [Methylobacterium]WFT80834.1 hypothetical protein QA634_02725 [Methylobacterium nodulans]
MELEPAAGVGPGPKVLIEGDLVVGLVDGAEHPELASRDLRGQDPHLRERR